VDVSPEESGRVKIETDHWKGGVESWEVTGSQAIKPTTVFEKEIRVEAIPAPGTRFAGWTSECTDEDLPLDKPKMTVKAFRTSCLTAHFEPSQAPGPAPEKPEPEPEPPKPVPSDCEQAEKIVEHLRAILEILKEEDGLRGL
jgi:hypothetical protein